MNEWIRDADARPPRGPAGRRRRRSSDAMARAAAAMHATGTVLVGDISNTLASPRVLADAGSRRRRVSRTDRIQPRRPGSAGARGVGTRDRARAATVADAEPGTDPDRLLRRRARARTRSRRRCSRKSSGDRATRAAVDPPGRVGRRDRVPADRDRGPIREMLEELGVWTGSWRAPGVRSRAVPGGPRATCSAACSSCTACI